MNSQTLAAIYMATLALLSALNSQAARPKTSTSPAAASETRASPTASIGKMRAVPFRGMIASVDDAARSFTIAGKQNSRLLKITDTTVITKGAQPATMKDIVVNEEVRGSYYKMGDGSLEAKTVKLGPLTEAEKAEKEARKEKREARKATATSPSPTP